MSHRPNVLIIVADQLSQQALRVHGNRDSRTPHIDRIAENGVAFSQCYTPCPLCQPARAAYWTGRFPHETGILSNGRKHHVPRLSDAIPTLGDLFSAAGYEAVHFGKTHDAGSLRGFTVEPQGNLPVEQVGPWTVNYDTTQDRYATERTVEYLRGAHDRPFLAVADLNNPHNICGYVGDYAGPHEDLPIPTDLPPLPTNFTVQNFTDLPLPVQYICCSHNRQSQAAGWNEMNYRHYLAAYYHYLSRVDAEIGRILDALYASPAGEETLIVFFADHGDGMGGRGLVTKQVSLYDETTRVPFIVAGAGVEARGGRQTHGLTSLLDLLPTLCDCAGIPAPVGLWGRSLLPHLRGNVGAVHEYVASEWHTEWGFTIEPGRMLRTDRYKYTRYLEGEGEELYDLREDPGETRSLARDPAHTGVLQAHRALLDAHLRETHDNFHQLENLVDPRWRSHTPGYHHHTGPAAPMVE